MLKKFKDVINSELAQILVADSQLITGDNLKLMYEKGILRFVLPTGSPILS
ncbi:MAG TPA: hypothetical protein VHY08_05210 [Bacillota bacterium]|nr:hypothetical protein [Bacillota bacterium]